MTATIIGTPGFGFELVRAEDIFAVLETVPVLSKPQQSLLQLGVQCHSYSLALLASALNANFAPRR